MQAERRQGQVSGPSRPTRDFRKTLLKLLPCFVLAPFLGTADFGLFLGGNLCAQLAHDRAEQLAARASWVGMNATILSVELNKYRCEVSTLWVCLQGL